MAVKKSPESAPETARLAEKSPMPAAWGSLLLPGYLGGLILVFIGERIVSSDGVRYASTGLGVLLATVTTALRFAGSGTAAGERGRAERALAFCSTGGLAALAIYFSESTEAGRRIFGIATAKPEVRARLEGAATVTWVSILLLSVLPLVMGEMALGPMRRAAMIEVRRVRMALQSGVILAAAAIYCALFTYAAGEVDAEVDYSYFRTARPSESTRNIAQSATETITVRAFFPQLNDVGAKVDGYLRELGRGTPNLKVETLDRLLVPSIAKEAKVSSDGVVVLSRGNAHETLTIGTDMKVAQGKLKTLDADFQKVLLKVLREPRVAYVTLGHGELTENRPDAAEGRTGKGLRKLLETPLNYTVKDLGMAQGLANDVPADATLVLVVGPSQAFLPEEVASLQRYADRGGHIFLALDPDAKVDLEPLAGLGGLSLGETVLANDKVFLPRRHNHADRVNLGTNRFSSHASVSTLSKNSARAMVLFAGAASLDKKPGADASLKVDFAVKAMPDTFEDKAGSFEYDAAADGKRQAFNLAAAVSRQVPPPAGYKGKDPPEYRAFVLADADVVDDWSLSSIEPNRYLFGDAIRWLGGEESFSGALTTGEDVRIEHTKAKDQLWFWSTLGGVPFLVLGVGFVVSRRARRVRPAQKEKSA